MIGVGADRLLRRIIQVKEDAQGKTLWWVAEGEDGGALQELLANIADLFDAGGVIYDDRNRVVHLRAGQFPGLSSDGIIKRFILRRKYDRLRFRFLNSKAVRSLHMALVLGQAGINTPKPLALLERRTRSNGIVYSYFVTEYIPNEGSLLDILEGDNHPLEDRLPEFLPPIAWSVRRMHDSGIIHNDLHGGNILIAGSEDARKFYFIDLNRARIKRQMSMSMRIKDLARLAFTPAQMELFLRAYTPDSYRDWMDSMLQMRRKREQFMERKQKLKKILRWQ